MMLLRHANAQAVHLKPTDLKGLGLFASRTLRKGECLAFVKQEDIFSSANIYSRGQNPYISSVKECLKGYEELKRARKSAFQEVELALLLFLERRSELLGFVSPWAQYLEALPTQQLWVKPEELISKFGLSIEDPTVAQLENYGRFVDVFAGALEGDLAQVATQLKEQNAWAVLDDDTNDTPLAVLLRNELAMVGSRAWDLDRVQVLHDKPLGLNSGEVCMFPEIDMLNHASAPNAQIVIPLEPQTPGGMDKLSSFPFDVNVKESGAGAAVFAARDIKPDEEVVITYGRKSPQAMYARYGFIESEESMPFMMTTDLKRQLAERGVANETIRTLTPKEAWDLIHPANGVKAVDLDHTSALDMV